MLKIPVASPVQEAYRPVSPQLQHWISAYVFRLPRLICLEDMENLTLTEICRKTHAYHQHLKSRLESRALWTLLLPGGNEEGEKRREECSVLFLISLVSHFLLSQALFVFPRCMQVAPAACHFSHWAMHGKCKHSAKRRQERSLSLPCKSFFQQSNVPAWCDWSRTLSGSQGCFSFGFRGPEGGLSSPAEAWPQLRQLKARASFDFSPVQKVGCDESSWS